jgi:acyl-CoA reductase-like NAD-dependent aldehyde dehydrogenase
VTASEAARERVMAVVRVGRRLCNPGDALGREARERLPRVTRLSPAGIELALSEHLETQPAARDVDRLIQRATPAARVWLLLSANVCTAPLRALACALAAAPEVLLRASRRDPVVAELLVRGLAADHAFAGQVTMVDALAPEAGDQLHAYGSDETMARLRAQTPPGVELLTHGSGFGVAAVECGADHLAAAQALARDVVPFDGQGCLSPRVVIVAGGAAAAEAFAAHLSRALDALAPRVPRGSLSAPEQAELSQYQALMLAVGSVHLGSDHLVAVDTAPEALALPPALRAVVVVACEPHALERFVAPWAGLVSAVGGEPGGALSSRLVARCRHARFSELGAMQRPPLDGPVDLRKLPC